jgi:hypothetical protein
MATPAIPSPDSAVLAQIERHLAELVVLQKKQLQAIRQLTGEIRR